MFFRDSGTSTGGREVSGEHLYMTPNMTIRGRLYDDAPNSQFFECGPAPFAAHAADEYLVNFAILVRLTPATDNSTTVDVLVDGTARPRSESGFVVPCDGTGRLERQLLRELEVRTGAMASTPM